MAQVLGVVLAFALSASAQPVKKWSPPRLVARTDAVYARFHVDMLSAPSSGAARLAAYGAGLSTATAVGSAPGAASLKIAAARTTASPIAARAASHGAFSFSARSTLAPRAGRAGSAQTSYDQPPANVRADEAVSLAAGGMMVGGASSAPTANPGARLGGSPAPVLGPEPPKAGIVPGSQRCTVTPTAGAPLTCAGFTWQAYASQCASICAIGPSSVCSPGYGQNGRGIGISCR